MKKIFLFLLFAIPVYPQLIISGGPSFLFTKSSGLDGFIERYNATRASILTKKMEPLGTMTGWSFDLGVTFGVYFDFGYTSLKGQIRAETDPVKTTGGGTFREMDISLSNFQVGTGLVAASERNIGLIFPYIEADVQSMSFETRTNTQSKSGDIGMIASLGIGGKLYIGLSEMFSVYVHPSYHFSLVDANFSEMYDATNTSYDYFSDQTKGSFGGFSIRVGIGLMINE